MPGGAPDGDRPFAGHRGADGIGAVAAVPAAHLSGDSRPVAPLLCGQSLHRGGRATAQRCAADRRQGPGFREPRTLRGPVAPGAGADGDRHLLCDDRPAARGAARLARSHRHRSCRWRGRRVVTGWLHHLMIAPILLPLMASALMLAFDERRRVLKRLASLGTAALLIVNAAALLWFTSDAGNAGADSPHVYLLGNWPAPFGIVLVVDRLSATMLLLTNVLGFTSLFYALARWDRSGPRFHALFLLLLMGVNGAFLTGDIRSEEHTSELQSLMRISYAVFCLKKKKNNSPTTATHTQIQ